MNKVTNGDILSNLFLINDLFPKNFKWFTIRRDNANKNTNKIVRGGDNNDIIFASGIEC